MAKDELYEYQYTTPNKKVVKECLPAVKTPAGKKKQKSKVFWGRFWMLVGGFGFLSVIESILSMRGIVFIAAELLIYGFIFFKGFAGFKKGREYLGRIDRYYRYMKALEHKKYMSLDELSQKVSKNVKTVIKDLEFMMDQKWFLEGHLDYRGGQFMLTDYVYEQYKLLEQGKILQEKEQEELEELQKDPAKWELAKVLEEGRNYIKEIKILNDVIWGENISTQLDKIEEILESIFEIVKRNPKKVPEVRKLIQYYLPMTIKAVTAYKNYENEKVHSDRLAEGKKEIEETLLKVHTAFVNLREKLLQDDFLDVSTDLDVLETLMSQEGLIEKEGSLNGKM